MVGAAGGSSDGTSQNSGKKTFEGKVITASPSTWCLKLVVWIFRKDSQIYSFVCCCSNMILFLMLIYKKESRR